MKNYLWNYLWTFFACFGAHANENIQLSLIFKSSTRKFYPYINTHKVLGFLIIFFSFQINILKVSTKRISNNRLCH